MITHRFLPHNQILCRFAVVALLGFATIWSAKAHAFQISAAQRAACTPDVLRLCSGELPDSGRVIACMRTNKSQVSAGCRAVIPASAWSGNTAIAER